MIKKIIFFILLTIGFTSTVNAEVKVSETNIKLEDGTIVYKAYTKNGTEKSGTTTSRKLTVTIDGKTVTGLCVDFAAPVNDGEATKLNQSLADYFNTVLNNKSKSQALANEINQYAAFGYGHGGRTSAKYLLATQLLIWEAITESGFYYSEYYSGRTGLGKIDLLEDIHFITDKDDYESRIDLSAEINAIKNAIRTHGNTPSFCSSTNKLEIGVGETTTYTDKNGVLAQFKINCSENLTCTNKGNDLTVKAEKEGSDNKITFTKEGSGEISALYRKDEEQGFIINTGSIEGVSCDFGIDTIKNQETADIRIVYIMLGALFCFVVAFVTNYTKKSLNELN